MEILIFLSLAVMTALVIMHISTRYSRMGRMIDKIPGPKPLPFIGNLLILWGTAEDLWHTFNNIVDNYYPVAKIWRAVCVLVFLRHPDDLKALLSCKTNIDKGDTVKYGYPWLEDSLFMSGGDNWHRKRKLLNAIFQLSNIKDYMNLTFARAEKFIRRMKSCEDGRAHAAKQLFHNLMLDVTCNILGINFDDLEPEFIEDYNKSIEEFASICTYRVMRPYIKDWMVPLLPLARVQEHSLNAFHNFSKKLIKMNRDYFNSRKIYEQMNNDFMLNSVDEKNDGVKIESKKSKSYSILDMLFLLERRGLINDEDLKQEVDAMIIAGHHTSGIALAFFAMLVAENSEIQERARAEVSDVLKHTNGKINFADVMKFEYLECCIKESIRLYPPAPMFVRQITEDIQLKTCRLPAGAEVLIHVFKVHRDPEYWPKPNKFDPERFLPENSVGRHPFSYLPFGAGPRNCIGKKLGMMQMKAIAALLLYNFKLESIVSTADVRIQSHMMLHTEDPLSIKFVRIHR